MPFETLCGPTLPDLHTKDEAETYECDYDKNPTSLYEAIEDAAWIPALYFMKTGKWEGGLFLTEITDPLPAERQARTWVTRFESDGEVRWSQLPLHAAIIFGAPLQVVKELLRIYPQAVRCTDDQHMLPMHLAMKYGSEDGVILCLLANFPEAIFTKDIRDRIPTEVEGPRDDRSKIIDSVVAIMTKTLSKRHGVEMGNSMAELKDDLALQKNLNADLERDKKQLEKKFDKAQSELSVAHTRLSQFREGIRTKAKKSAKLTSQEPEESITQERNPKSTRQKGGKYHGKGSKRDSIRNTPVSIVFGSNDDKSKKTHSVIPPKSNSKGSIDTSGKLSRKGFFKGFQEKE